MAIYDEICVSTVGFYSGRLYILVPAPKITDYFTHSTTQNFNNVIGDGPALHGWYVYNSYGSVVTWDANISIPNAIYISTREGPDVQFFTSMAPYPFVYKAIAGNFNIEMVRIAHTTLLCFKDPQSARDFMFVEALSNGLRFYTVVGGSKTWYDITNVSRFDVRVERTGQTFYFYGLRDGAYILGAQIVRNDFGPITEVGVLSGGLYTSPRALEYIRSLYDVEVLVESSVSLTSTLAELQPMIRLQETLAFSERQKIGFLGYLLDLLGTSDATPVIVSAILMDYFYLTTQNRPNFMGTRGVSENLFISGNALARRHVLESLGDTFSFEEEFANLRDFYSFVFSSVRFRPSPISNVSFTQLSISELFRLASLTTYGAGESLQDILSVVDTVTYSYIIATLLTNSLVFSETSLLGFEHMVTDSVTTRDTTAGQSYLQIFLDDSFNFHIRMVSNGETYQVWSFLTPALYASIYTNFNFNSFAVLGDATYGASSQGIFRITQTDDQLHTGVRYNLFNMGTHRKKRMYRAYFGATSDRTPAVRVLTDDHDIIYQLVNGRANMAQGQQGRYWIFDLHQVEGVHFMEYVPIVLER